MNLKELSPNLAARAGIMAGQRNDPRGHQQMDKFMSYARTKIHHKPDINLQVVGDKSVTKMSVLKSEKLHSGWEVAVLTDGGSRFSIVISNQTHPFTISVPTGNDMYKNAHIDRRGAIFLSKILGAKPTDFPLSRTPEKQQSMTEYFMKENLEVKEFSLKQIAESLGKMSKDGGPKFGDEVQKLSPQQKKDLMEKVSKFNEYGKVLRCETALMEMSKTLSEIGQMAESYAMTESSDYFQGEVVKRDFKEVRSITKDFNKLAKECYSGLQQLNALYEDMGGKMARYFEIKSLDEIASGIPQTSQPAPQLGESAEEQEEYASGFEEQA